MNSRASVMITFLALCIFLLADIDGVRADDNLRKKAPPGDRLTREAVLENHERRRDKLQELLQETKDKVADHEAGRNLLEQEEYETVSKRIGLYDRKLTRMNEPLDERDIERMLERERVRADRYNRVEL